MHAIKASQMIRVGVDHHLVGPGRLFEGRLPSRSVARVPRIAGNDEGADVWVFNGTVVPNTGSNAVAGRPRAEYGIDPTAMEEMRPGCDGIHAPVNDMNAGGLLAAINLPSSPASPGGSSRPPRTVDLVRREVG